MAGDDKPDLCVIGGGTGGHAVALAAAAIGARCTLVDPADRLGRGQAADLAEASFLREALGKRPGDDPLEWTAFRRGLGLVLATDHANHAAARLAAAGVTVIRGAARFLDARTISANDMPIRARRFVLATGASLAEPDWASALPARRLVRPATLLSGDALPAAIGIVTAIPAGLAWAQALSRLGTAVTLVAEPGALGRFDPELVRPVLDALRRDGVEIVLRAAPCDSCPIEGGGVMIIGPRVPATAALGLTEAGIDCRQGSPTVDRRLRTTNPRVHAIGDVLGTASPGSLTQQVGLVLRTALFRLPVWRALAPAPDTLRTDPPIAQVGRLAPAASAEAGVILRFPLGEAMPGMPGLVKVRASKGGRIVGAGIVGPGAAEAIALWGFAMARGVPAGAIATLPMPPATAAEAGRRAALGFLTGRLRGAWVQRLIKAIRRLP